MDGPEDHQHRHPTNPNDIFTQSYCKEFDKCHRPSCNKVHVIEIVTKEDLDLVKIAANGLSKSDDKCSNKKMTKTSSTDNINNRTTKNKKKSKKKDESPKVIFDKIFYAQPSTSKDGSILRHSISNGESDESDVDDQKVHLSRESNLFLPIISGSTSFDPDQELNQLRSSLAPQKWALKRWVKLKQNDVQRLTVEVRNEIKSEKLQVKSKSSSTLDSFIEKASQRIDCGDGSKTSASSLRKGTCCFVDDLSNLCSKPSLPFTRHCQQHILYNVDQLLFTRCTAKSSTHIQCSQATFDIERNDPLCDFHSRQSSVPSEESKDTSKCTSRKRTKPLALLRPARRKKRKGKGIGNSNDSQEITIPDDKIDLEGLEPSVESNIVPPPPYEMTASVNGNNNVLHGGLELPSLPVTDEALVAAIIEDPIVQVHDGSVDPLDFDNVLNAFPEEFFDPQNQTNRPTSAFPHPHLSSHLIKESVHSESVMMNTHPIFPKGICHPTANGSPSTYSNYLPTHSSNHLDANGHLETAISETIVAANSLPTNDDIANNILSCLTAEQQQQLNGLIDGALASGTLPSSPTTKLPPVSSLHMIFPDGVGEVDSSSVPGINHVTSAGASSLNFKPGFASQQHHNSGDLNSHVVHGPAFPPQPAQLSRINLPSVGHMMDTPRLEHVPLPPVNTIHSGFNAPTGPLNQASCTIQPFVETTTGSIIISGLNEGSLSRTNHFVRLTDHLNNQISSPGGMISGPLITPKTTALRQEDISSV